MSDRSVPAGHNGGQPLDDPAPERQGRCRECIHWTPPPEGLERDYEAFRLGLSRRCMKRPTGFCDRVLLGISKIPAFSGTQGNFSCRNFEAAPPRPEPKGGGFVTIWSGNRVVWKGPEDEVPPRFRAAIPIFSIPTRDKRAPVDAGTDGDSPPDTARGGDGESERAGGIS